MSEPAVLTLDEVARTLRMSTRWFRVCRPRLHEAGFPQPLAGLPRPYRWSASAVQHWIEGAGARSEADAREAMLSARADAIVARMGQRRRRASQ